ncbi:MAG: D-2-hydroxyacid dehydrogenase [Planctomycetota bacterium]|jgi:glycerate dehydrogenase
MKVVFLDVATINLNDDMDFSSIKAIGELVCYANSSEAEAIERGGGAETVIVNKVPMTKRVMGSLPGLKHIAVIATGYNNVDISTAREAGICVTNVRGYAKDCVPQHTFALILNLATRTCDYNRDIRNGRWQKSGFFTLLSYPTFELAGKTIGIIGFGAIGRGVARIAEAMGMKVMTYDVGDFEDDEYKKSRSSVDEIFEKADIVSLHCPLTADNKYMVNREVFKKMKSSAILINTARGPLVDQAALAEALNNDEIAGAGIDVLDEEPPRDNPLLGDVKNLIMTPHSAWSTREARQRLIDEVAENIKAFSEGRERNIIQR